MQTEPNAGPGNPKATQVYTLENGCAVIEQDSVRVVLDAEQIQAVIKQLHVCYDYCALWKEPKQEQDSP